MPDFLKNFFDSINSILSKISMTQKLIAGGVLLVAVVGLIFVFTMSSSSDGVPLFTKRELQQEDFDRITTKLADMGVTFTTEGKNIIYVKDESTRNKVIMDLAEQGFMPQDSYSWKDILNSNNMTSTEFLNNIKKRAAVESKLENMIKSSDLIQSVDVNFTVPERSVFVRDQNPVKVAVKLTPMWGVDLLENRNAIKGYQGLILNSIDGATEENLVITDNTGIILNDFTGEDDDRRIKTAKENLKIRENQINKYKNDIYRALSEVLPYDRFSVVVDVMMNFDQEEEERSEVLPVILKEDDPRTPYDDGERRYSIPISTKKTSEKFDGPGWIPEGPPGFDTNVPPAYQGALEQITQYLKNEEIVNEVTSESRKKIIKDPWGIDRITAAVTIDGTYEIEYDENGKPEVLPGGRRKRKYIPPTAEELQTIKSFVEQAVGNSVLRSDSVVVSELRKDRTAQFEKEDEIWRNKQRTFWIMLAVLGGLLLLIIGVFIYRMIQKELERRRRLREEELARQHQLAREMALKSAEEEGVEVEMSMEDKARLEMQENAVNLAREHPEDVAQLIRTWLQEE